MKNDICGIDFKRRASRGATSDGSRGFQPTVRAYRGVIRRGATVDCGVFGEMCFRRRSATRDGLCVRFRGLKPTATIMGSLRDHACRRAANEGSLAFQRPDKRTNGDPRRGAAVELADLNQEAAVLAKKIQKNFEGLGV